MLSFGGSQIARQLVAGSYPMHQDLLIMHVARKLTFACSSDPQHPCTRPNLRRCRGARAGPDQKGTVSGDKNFLATNAGTRRKRKGAVEGKGRGERDGGGKQI